MNYKLTNCTLILTILSHIVWAQTDFDQLHRKAISLYNICHEKTNAEINYPVSVQDFWADVDYTCLRSSLKALKRIEDMVNLWTCEGSSYHHDDSVLHTITTTLNYYIKSKPIQLDSNCMDTWFDRDISIPLRIGKLLILMKSYLPKELIFQGAQHISSEWGTPATNTGQNLLWRSQLMIIKSILLEDVALMERVINEGVMPSLTTGGDEGIQVDYSFHQHNSYDKRGLLYSGGYGYSFIRSATFIANLLEASEWELTEEEKEIIAHLITDGLGGMIWKKTLDHHVIGRRIAMRNVEVSALPKSIKQLTEILNDDSLVFALNQISNSITTGVSTNQKINQYYWTSDYMSHQRPNFYFSVKMVSRRTKGTEILNNQNRKAHWLPFGSTVMMRSGNEYDNIFPLWNWYRIPGVTNPQNHQGLFWKRITQESEFVGGVTNGTLGTGGMKVDIAKLKANKSWFLTDDRVVCLGSSITYDGEDSLTTTINQCRFDGEVVLESNQRISKINNDTLLTLDSSFVVKHDGIRYNILGPGVGVLEISTVTSNWNTIGTIDQPISGRIFSLYINHKEKHNSQYGYVIGFDDQDKNNDFLQYRVLEKGDSLHAIHDEKLNRYSLVFFQAKSIKIENCEVAVNHPCMMLITVNKNEWKISVSSPLAEIDFLELTFDKQFNMNRSSDISQIDSKMIVRLPDGDFIGKSKTFEITLTEN